MYSRHFKAGAGSVRLIRGVLVLVDAWRAAMTYRRAAALCREGKLAEAEARCDDILESIPEHFEALHLLGIIRARQGLYAAAELRLAAAVESNPQSAEAHANRAGVLKVLRRYDDALASCDRALALNPELVGVLNIRGVALAELKRHEEALASLDRALALKPSFVEALNNRSAVLTELKRYGEALANLDQAVALKPEFLEALNNRAGVLKELERYDEALASLDRALALQPDFADGLSNRGAILNCLKRFEEALVSLDRALALKPNLVGALNNRGIALRHLKRNGEALSSFDRALALQPDFVEVLRNRGSTLSDMGRHEEAIRALERALALGPDLPSLKGGLLLSKMTCCDWRSYEELSDSVIADVRLEKSGVNPFTFLGISKSSQDQLQCARRWVRDECPPSPSAVWTGERYQHRRIRIAYLSADFRHHATSRLIVGLFEHHDRDLFETTAIAFGPDTRDTMRARVQAAFEHFIDVREKTDREVASLMREREIDIAVDLGGFTTHSRTKIVALRPAPIQVSYLGFPATIGAEYIDYLVADTVVIPPSDQPWFSEKIVYLPDSYQVNDSRRWIPEWTRSRAQAGLPETGFVFCSFNNNFKINPAMFDVWMRLLREIGGSVLWLLEGNAAVPANLRREATTRGVAPERLVFAPKIAYTEHLARQRLADLFLDSLPCNAHTTASDALWVGLPVLTCSGTTFAGRVAASVLRAAGLPELITFSLEDYETLALRLARDREMLAGVRGRLAQHRHTCPLFDTDRFRRHLEAAYTAMWERWQRGDAPAAFAVPPIR